VRGEFTVQEAVFFGYIEVRAYDGMVRTIKSISFFVLVAFGLPLTVGCRSHNNDRPIGKIEQIHVPLGLPPVPVPKDNPPTAETIALGRRLFYDPRLSKDNSLACASCHNSRLGFTDSLEISRGVGGMTGTRNAPTLINVAYLPLQFWDGRASSLEEQAASPIADPVEMNQTHEVSVSKLGKDPSYKAIFLKAFGPGPITIGRVEKSLASFERTILSGDSAFDRYEFSGDKQALSPAQIRGLAIFKDPHRGNCAACHTINSSYALFTDGKFHNIGEGAGDDGVFKDIGRYHVTQLESDKGAFMTPALRNIAETAPYMHDGSLRTLKEVVDFYAGGGNSNPYLDKEIHEIKLSGQDRSDLVEFLKALTGPMPPGIGSPGKE
jgi:cytochrome c peroxidase